MSDGVDRHYVLTDKKQNKFIPPKANTVIFGSKKYVELLLHASKVITAFIENNNVFPFPEKNIADMRIKCSLRRYICSMGFYILICRGSILLKNNCG